MLHCDTGSCGVDAACNCKCPDCTEANMERLRNALLKIHDLAGQLGRVINHPHVLAIQAFVHGATGPCERMPGQTVCLH